MNDDDPIKCVCGIRYELKEFINHFKKCDLFYSKFKDFDCKMVALLKQFINSKDNLIIIIFLINRFMDILKNKLKSLEDEINPKNFIFKKTITFELSNQYCYNYRACLFSSKKDDNIYAAYGTLKYDLECYDILNDKKFTVIKKLYNSAFHSCRHFYDDKNNTDLILTCFSKDNKIKVINFQRQGSKVILNLGPSHREILIRTSYFLNGKIIIPLSDENNNGLIQIYNLETKQKINFSENLGLIFCINNYFHKKANLNYTLICNKKGIFIYLIETFCFFKAFFGDIDDLGYVEAYILEKNENLILIGVCLNTNTFDNLYIWNFENGDLIKKVKSEEIITDINIWDDNYIFISLFNDDYLFSLIDINDCSVVKEFNNFNNQKGSGIKILRDKMKGDYLILLSLYGNLDLYTLNN